MRKILAAAFALAVFIRAVAAHGAESVGKAQAVNPGINAGFEQTRRLVGAGGDIFFGETIASDPTGVLRVVFADRSKLELGPDSSIVVDEFVYAAKPSAQKLALSLVKGVFRFTSGEMDKKAYSLDAGKVQLGVRGTKFTVLADGLGSVLVTVERGVVEMKAGGRTLLVEANSSGSFDAASEDLEVAEAADLGDFADAVEAMDASLESADIAVGIDAADADTQEDDAAKQGDEADDAEDNAEDAKDAEDGGTQDGDKGGDDGGGDGGAGGGEGG